MQTTLDLNGANCPYCFHDTLARLGRIDGVSNVHGSMGGSCIVIDHDDDVAVDTLVAMIHGHLHGIEKFSNEIEMVSVDLSPLARSCTHHQAAPQTSPIPSTTSGEAFAVAPSMTLGEIVTLKPSLAAELQRRGFDFCCHGDRTLTDAAAALDLDAQNVAEELSAIRQDEPPAEWAYLRPVELIDHIVSTHHRYLWDELPRIGELVDKIVAVHGDRHPELAEVQRFFVELRSDFEPHLTCEEQVVFPAMRAVMASPAGPPESAVEDLPGEVRSLMEEHEVVGELLEKLRETTSDYLVPSDGCATFAETYRALGELEADTHLHVHKENNVLFPAFGERESTTA